MWVKKAPEELAADRRNSRRQVCLALLSAPFLVYAAFRLPLLLRVILALGAAVFFLGWSWRIRWNRARAKVFVCDQCNAVKSASLACPCGGSFTSLAHMKWHEPVSRTSAQIAASQGLVGISPLIPNNIN